MRQNSSMTMNRAYAGGGSWTLIDTVDDEKYTQQTNATGMKGESMKGVQSPQNYGFTSVNMPATRGKDGQIDGSAEAPVNFMGGNRSLPVMGNIGDERHRLYKLGKGDSAMHRCAEDRQQFHMSETGNYMSCRDDRVQRMALVPKPQDDQQQQQGNGGQQAGGAGEQGKQQEKKMGQESAKDDNEKSTKYFQQSGSEHLMRHESGHVKVKKGDVLTYVGSEDRSTRVDDNHTHESFAGNTVFVDPDGCWSTAPILQKDDPCGGGGGSAGAGGNKPGAPMGAPHPIA